LGETKPGENVGYLLVRLLHPFADGLLLLRLKKRHRADFGEITAQQVIDGLSLPLDISIRFGFVQQVE
jgi:hypothetical protein